MPAMLQAQTMVASLVPEINCCIIHTDTCNRRYIRATNINNILNFEFAYYPFSTQSELRYIVICLN